MLRVPARYITVVVALSGLVLCGCGGEASKRPPMGKVKGVVTYKGKPVSDAVVAFNQEHAPRAATGKTDAEGKFQLTTWDTNDGAILGTHKVTVTKSKSILGDKDPATMTPDEIMKKMQENPKPALENEVPAKYADVKTTPLQISVEAGEKEIKIDLED